MLALFALQDDGGGAAGLLGLGLVSLLYCGVILLVFASMWKIFVKAGRPGWAGIIPIYNTMVLAEIVGKPMWWGLLTLVPCVGIVVAIILLIELAKCFGKSVVFAIVGLLLFGIIGLPILAFGDAKYTKPATAP